MGLVPLLLGFFGVSGPIANFFFRIGKKVIFTTTFLPIQITFVGALFVSKIAFLIAIITLIFTVYNQFSSLLDYVNFLSTDSFLKIPFDVLNSMGVFQAFYDAFSIFSVTFLSVLVLFVSKYFIESIKLVSDEFYKIGMLINSGT